MFCASLGKVFEESSVNVWVSSEGLVLGRFHALSDLFYDILCLMRTALVLRWVFAENSAAADKQIGCWQSHAKIQPDKSNTHLLSQFL